jgi:hypothetical protein
MCQVEISAFVLERQCRNRTSDDLSLAVLRDEQSHSAVVCQPVAAPQRRFDYPGQVRPLWVDAQTFLEVKIEGAPRRIAGKMRPVEIYYRDYKSGKWLDGSLRSRNYRASGQAIA